MDEVLLGEIVGVFGFRGEVRLMLHHREGETLFGGEVPATLVGPGGERRDVRLSAREGAGKRVIGRIQGVDSEEGARALMGWAVVVDRGVLPEPGEGEYYVHDLLGLPVFDESGAALGTVEDVVAGDDRDVWVVKRTDGAEAFLVANPENVRAIDLDAGRIVVADGALDEGE